MITAVANPILSVMIPTWNPDPAYLELAVRSAVTQLDVGRDVEIALVDDCSPDFDPHAFVERLGLRRVAVHRNAQRLGLAGAWNACFERARGRWVHLLHQDDYVLPGFYAALCEGFAREPRAGAAYCATRMVDAGGVGWVPKVAHDAAPGVLEDWRLHVFEKLSIQCSAIVVRRDVHQTLGGFDARFQYALDWDMWKRIAVRYPLWFHPEALACYRMHAASETARQRPDGTLLEEIFRSIEHSSALLPPEVAGGVARRARSHYAVFAAENALAVVRAGGPPSAALRQLRIARRHASTVGVLAALVRVAARSVKRVLTRARRMPSSIEGA